jgi:hypothetical protein
MAPGSSASAGPSGLTGRGPNFKESQKKVILEVLCEKMPIGGEWDAKMLEKGNLDVWGPIKQSIDEKMPAVLAELRDKQPGVILKETIDWAGYKRCFTDMKTRPWQSSMGCPRRGRRGHRKGHRARGR